MNSQTAGPVDQRKAKEGSKKKQEEVERFQTKGKKNVLLSKEKRHFGST